MSYILVVEDDPATLMMVSRSLTLSGYLVKEASSAESALAIMNGEKPKLVVLDLELPRMSGVDLLNVAQDKLADVPVVVVTGHKDHVEEMLPTVVVTVMPKPTNFTELVKIVDGFLKSGKK